MKFTNYCIQENIILTYASSSYKKEEIVEVITFLCLGMSWDTFSTFLNMFEIGEIPGKFTSWNITKKWLDFNFLK
jgi:hypothetical protein